MDNNTDASFPGKTSMISTPPVSPVSLLLLLKTQRAAVRIQNQDGAIDSPSAGKKHHVTRVFLKHRHTESPHDSRRRLIGRDPIAVTMATAHRAPGVMMQASLRLLKDGAAI